MVSLALHQSLLRPEAYPDRPGTVGFRETHVSRLYFTEHRVYKVKKPVDLGFLDFTSLDRRRFYCNEEIRLNHRFAPDTYLGVEEIRQSGNRIRIGGTGKIIDYAVVMRRLPEQKMLDRRIELNDQRLGEEMRRLGRRLADLHEESEICPGQPGKSNLDIVRFNWEENLSQTLDFRDRTLSREAHKRLTEYVNDFIGTHEELLLRRETQGWVREVHGDLHAEHICLTDPIRIYDCIEFNRRFRVADVVADLAFLLMDLEFRGRRDLASRLHAVYCELFDQGCKGTEELLPFYKVYRAFVRGKVESFLLDTPEADTAQRLEAGTRAHRYFNLALGYLCPPFLVVLCGLMGTGKTTLGKGVATALGGTLLRSDVIRKELAGIEETQAVRADFEEALYAPEVTTLTYRQMLQKAKELLGRNRPVVVDASFADRAWRQRFVDAASARGIPALILHLECPAERALERLDMRQASGQDASDGRREIYGRQAERFEPPTEREGALAVDTTALVDYNVDLCLVEILDRARTLR